jgi:site-specific recombinase XerD
VDAYTRHLEAEGKSPATVARRLSALSSFYEYGVGERVLSDNPVTRVTRPKVAGVSPRKWLSKDQARACLEAVGGMSGAHQALFGLCFLAGLRVSEALSVRVEDLGEADGHQVVRVTRKGGKADEVVLSPPCLRLLAQALDGRSEGRLIVGPRGGSIDRHRAARMVAEVGREAGLGRGLVPHDLRHSCAVLSLKAGAPLHRVQQQLGHADPRTTQRYTHHLEALDNAAAYDLGRFLA